MRGLSFFEVVETVPEGARGESRERFRAERRALCATQPEGAPPRSEGMSPSVRGVHQKKREAPTPWWMVPQAHKNATRVFLQLSLN